MWKIVIFFNVIWFTIRAWIILNRNQIRKIKKYKVSLDSAPSPEQISEIVKYIDQVSSLFIKGNQNRCFYRSYILYNILSKHNVSLETNIGLTDMSLGSTARGHCWLTSNNIPFYEKNEVEKYPYFLGSNGVVKFWMNLNVKHGEEKELKILKSRLVN